MTTEERWLTITDIATRLQIHPEMVRRRIGRKELPANNVDGSAGYQVLESDLDTFLAHGMRAVAVDEPGSRS